MLISKTYILSFLMEFVDCRWLSWILVEPAQTSGGRFRELDGLAYEILAPIVVCGNLAGGGPIRVALDKPSYLVAEEQHQKLGTRQMI